jgi:hypothetical protein
MPVGASCAAISARTLRMMKIQEVLLRALARKITWFQAAEILGFTDRHLRRIRERYQAFGYDGLLDRRLDDAAILRKKDGQFCTEARILVAKSPLRSLTLALYRYSSKRLAFFCFIELRILEAYSSDEMQSKPGIPASAFHPFSEERNRSSFMEMPVLAESCFMNSESIGVLPTRALIAVYIAVETSR